MKKQTAVEWLEQQLFNKRGSFNKSDIDQAKEMEKKQIISAYNTSFLLRYEPYSTAEKYYYETYKKQKQ
jgi:hypothetical protein